MSLGQFTFSYNDYDGDNGLVGGNLVPLTAANLAAQQALLVTYQAALQNIILGEPITETIVLKVKDNSTRTKATDVNAQRGKKWLVTFVDVSQYLDAPANVVVNPNYLKTSSYELPTADLAARGSNQEIIYTKEAGSSFADAAYQAAIDAYVDAAEDVRKSVTGGLIEIVQIESVSRNVD